MLTSSAEGGCSADISNDRKYETARSESDGWSKIYLSDSASYPDTRNTPKSNVVGGDWDWSLLDVEREKENNRTDASTTHEAPAHEHRKDKRRKLKSPAQKSSHKHASNRRAQSEAHSRRKTTGSHGRAAARAVSEGRTSISRPPRTTEEAEAQSAFDAFDFDFDNINLVRSQQQPATSAESSKAKRSMACVDDQDKGSADVSDNDSNNEHEADHRDHDENYDKHDHDDQASDEGSIDLAQLLQEVDSRWILNLSMQFRDETKKEKLFITYAPQSNLWRRVTVTWDYAEMRPGSLEEDLKSLSLQRDKSIRVYESVRLDLPKIHFKDTATQLRLKTEDDDKLHIYVDVDESQVIDYPPIGLAEHMDIARYRESDVLIDQHLSGFVYRVKVKDEIMVKKEIPSPKSVDEFIYEMNGLEATAESASVVDLKGLVMDEEGECITAILIAFASQGPLVDLVYDHRDTNKLPWSRRRKWAHQIIAGVSAIHEAGFVQGDMTLSNVVIDSDDNASIIDLNRRGCPVGWEPPELLRLFLSRQKINMMVGVKSDLFQLGMVLWALAEQVDEPDRVDRDELHKYSPEIPDWYRDIVDTCLSERPQDRRDGVTLLRMFDDGLAYDQELRNAFSLRSRLSPRQEDERHQEQTRGRLRVPSQDIDRVSHHSDSRHDTHARGLSVASSTFSHNPRRNAGAPPYPSLHHRRSKQSVLSQGVGGHKRDTSRISERSSVFRPEQDPYLPPAHQDSGLADMMMPFRGRGNQGWSLAHQDSGFGDFGDVLGGMDPNRYIQAVQEGPEDDEARDSALGVYGVGGEGEEHGQEGKYD